MDLAAFLRFSLFAKEKDKLQTSLILAHALSIAKLFSSELSQIFKG